MKTKTILSVDPGTRYSGITVFKGKEIVVSMVKTFSTNGSPRQRLNEVKKVFSSLIEDYAPEVLVLEKPFPFWSKQSHLLNVVIEEIKSIAKKEKIEIQEFCPKSVKKIVCGSGNTNKKEMAVVICSIYPELKIYLKQMTKSQEKYWNHMFDAVGLGVCYLKKQGKNKMVSHELLPSC